MQTFNSITALFIREFKISYRNYSDILSIMLFFLLGILIFVFSTGPVDELIEKISVGIIWTLILLSNNLCLKRFYQDDFNNGNIFLFHISGLSFEIIVIIKIISTWLFLQLPFFILILIAGLLLNIETNKITLILLTFLIGSPILTSISSISGSMNLLNNRNFSIGSLIIMILSIPVIIFSVGIINAPIEMINPQINILLGVLFLFLAITPWICAACIKIALEYK